MPDKQDRLFAQALFRQALHDFEDAKALQLAGRYAATVVSSQHAVEKALKAVVYLLKGRAVYTTPRHQIVDKPTLMVGRTLTFRNRRLGRLLIDEIRWLESLIPANTIVGRNTEYPYYESPTSPTPKVPGDEFSDGEATRAIRAAEAVIRKIKRAYRRLNFTL